MVIVMKEIEIDRASCLAVVKREGDHEVGAGPVELLNPIWLYKAETCPAVNIGGLLTLMGAEGWEAWHIDSTERQRDGTAITVRVYFKRQEP